MFKARNSSPARRYTETITFGGLDTSSPHFQAESNHALDMCNYIFENGVVRKRKGTRQVFDTIKSENYFDIYATPKQYLTQTADAPINGLYQLDDMLIIHKGNLLYYTDIATMSAPKLITNDKVEDGGNAKLFKGALTAENKPSWGIVSNHKLWLLTGRKYAVLYKSGNVVKATPVEETEYVYIPTTTIGITPVDSEYATRMSYESVNMMTPMRKNVLVGGGDFKSLVYVLDGNMTNPLKTKLKIKTTGRA